MPGRVISQDVIGALAGAGVIAGAHAVRRVVIDLQQGHIPVIHVEQHGDSRLLDITRSLNGAVTIRTVPEAHGHADAGSRAAPRPDASRGQG